MKRLPHAKIKPTVFVEWANRLTLWAGTQQSWSELEPNANEPVVTSGPQTPPAALPMAYQIPTSPLLVEFDWSSLYPPVSPSLLSPVGLQCFNAINKELCSVNNLIP